MQRFADGDEKNAGLCFITSQKICFFGVLVLYVVNGCPVGLLSMLPKEFTREDVKALRIAQGMKPDPKMVISNWVKRGLVVRDESRGVCVKVVSSQ